MGLSSIPATGYEKWNQAADIRALLDHFGIEGAVIVGHDIGTMVAYAYAARYPEKTVKLVVMDAPVPGIPPWNEIVRDPRLWHFDLGGPDMERLVAGRERIYLDRFWNEFSANPAPIRRSGARALCQALRHAGRNAFRLHAIRRLRPGRSRQSTVPGQGQACDASAGNRGRKIVWRDHGQDHAICRQQCARRRHPGLRPLDHGGKPARHHRHGAGLPGNEDLALTGI